MEQEVYQRYYYNDCPKCGKKKYRNSKVCFDCYSSAIPKTSRHTKEPCPRCGRPKLLSSKICRQCVWEKDVYVTPGRTCNKPVSPSPRLEIASPEFLNQFVGLFLGEGCIHPHLSRGGTIGIRLEIKLRADDEPALKTIHSILGGSLRIYLRKDGHSNEVIWSLYKSDDVLLVLKTIRPLVVIPMRKVKEIDLAIEYIDLRKSESFHGVDRERNRRYYEQFHELKQFQV